MSASFTPSILPVVRDKLTNVTKVGNSKSMFIANNSCGNRSEGEHFSPDSAIISFISSEQVGVNSIQWSQTRLG